jgi:ATP-dependent DNA helicase RecQ
VPCPPALPGGEANPAACHQDARPDTLLPLARRFGIDRLHPFQREAIDALLRPGGRVLLVAPTGGGKSLCYQLPALALPGKTLVLSPLISLMEDQVRSLTARGIAATFVASSLPRDENGRRLFGLRRGDYKLIYAAPERLAVRSFLDVLASIDLDLVAIDEAHCIVQWGHDFRPDYRRIGEVLQELRPSRAIACTATATPDARREITGGLGWTTRDTKVILRGFARPNLHLRARDADGAAHTLQLTTDALRATLGSPQAPRGAGIVYAATRRGTERIAEHLRTEGWNAGVYHAGLPPDVRANLSAAFSTRRTGLVVATNAFGMGIDRPDVRVVVHAQLPSSIDAYYQEVGRAGRDGLPATGLLLVSDADIALRRRMCMLGPGGEPAAPADAARAFCLLREMLRYADAGACRHDFILRYFGDDAESLGGCGHCDACLSPGGNHLDNPATLARDPDVIRRVLSGVARARGGAGMQAVASMLAGERTARVAALGLDALSTFGVMSGRSTKEILRIVRVMIAHGFIDLTPAQYPVPVVTELGWRMLLGKEAARVRPAELAPQSRTTLAGNSPAPENPANPPPLKNEFARLFEALRQYRAELARSLRVPAYVIAPNRTLSEIAMLRPMSADQLRLAYGMGPARISAYGEGFLNVVRKSTNLSPNPAVQSA